ncbi:nucleotidyltransferase family protein [Paracidovorax sp. MALMAid1276]|uniref:nucleotidyltransferase family protein n=1 Tax=Paracidovorax sp. MALMAid1276 TaxID=3411631 RepID=UPI003B9D2A2B
MLASSSPGPVVLVLASGRGERFKASGGATHKLCAPLGSTTVLEHTLAAVRASGLAWHVEDAGHPGMGDSIAAAVRATAGANGWLVLPGDLPLVLPGTLRSMACALQAAAAEGGAVVQPVYQGERGHPVGFASACGAELMTLTGEQGAARIVRQYAQQGRLRQVSVEDVGTVTDVDTVQDLARAEEILAQRLAASAAHGGSG